MNDSALASRPDHRAVLAQLGSPSFQAGVDARRWHLISLEWPHALIAVSAAPRDGAPDEFVLRFELSGYPDRVTAGLWDCEAGTLLPAERRPKGERATVVFRSDWEGGRALYAAWDSTALTSHADWGQTYPLSAWHSGRGLTFYLTNVFEVMNTDDYLGV